MKAGFARDLGEAIPGAGVETIVAAVNAVANRAAEFQRNGAVVLDGQVGNAAGGGELAWGGDGLGGTGCDAGGAFATMVARGLVAGDFEGGEEFAKEEPGAELAMNLHRRFTIPAESGGTGEIAL